MDSKSRGCSDNSRQHYDKFYADGGWGTTVESAERATKVITGLAGWEAGDSILEVGCGDGLHSFLLSLVGLHVTAIDISPVAINGACDLFDGPEFIIADLAEWEPGRTFDGILARGLSWFHYELSGINRNGVDVLHELRRMLSWLSPGGTFVLQIYTDLSGGVRDGCIQNIADAYRSLFEPVSTILFLRDWHGEPLNNQTQAGVIVVASRDSGGT